MVPLIDWYRHPGLSVSSNTGDPAFSTPLLRKRLSKTAIARSWTTRSASPAIVKPLEASLMVAMFTALTATIIALKLVITESIWRKPMPEPEPLSRPSSRFPRFLIGQDTRGRWVVQDQRGLCGGLFVSRAEAIRYAMFESGCQPQAVIMVPGVLELDTARGHAPASQQVKRRAA